VFDHFVWSVLVVPTAVVVVAAVLADRLPPSAGVTAFAWSAAATAAASLVTVGAFTIKAAGEVPGIAARFGTHQIVDWRHGGGIRANMELTRGRIGRGSWRVSVSLCTSGVARSAGKVVGQGGRSP
jgi:hypothetical protein